NNPITFVDPDGKDILFWQRDEKTRKWNRVKFQDLDETTQNALIAFAETDEGYAFLSDFANKGDKIGDVEFNTDGKYSDHNLDYRETAKWYENNGTSTIKDNRFKNELVFNDKGTISFQLTINRADKREYGSVSDLAVTTGHEAFIHLERRIELLLKAYESGDMKEVQRVYKEIRKNMNGGINSNEHKRYINNHPDYQRIK